MSTLDELMNYMANRGYYINRAGRTERIDHIPLVSHIVDNLYVGGCVGSMDLEDNFSHVFSMYDSERYVFGEGTHLHEVRMYDSERGLDVETVEKVSDLVADALAAGGNVLVHCQAGINRSNLVAARALMKTYGMSSTEAVKLLEEKRDRLILSNSVFRNYVLHSDFPVL